MAKFANERKGGRKYNVRVTDTKQGDLVGTFTVVATNPPTARKAACEMAANRVIDPSRLHAHGPTRA